jgi:hypothetical protein
VNAKEMSRRTESILPTLSAQRQGGNADGAVQPSLPRVAVGWRCRRRSRMYINDVSACSLGVAPHVYSTKRLTRELDRDAEAIASDAVAGREGEREGG